MPDKSKIDRYNRKLLEKLSVFLNLEPDYIKEETVKMISRECDLSDRDAYAYLLASALYMDVADDPDDRELFELYFLRMLCESDLSEYINDPYLTDIKFPCARIGRWEFKKQSYAPYEAFVSDDMIALPDGRVIPQISYFPCEYSYPCVCEDGREWMLITPNEINTMKKPISRAHGKVLTFGLGLGYFAYMAACKDDVSSVTVVERDCDVISLFRSHILPQMRCKDKIRIVEADAHMYAKDTMKDEKYDFVFCDIWHDPSDGVGEYQKFKKYEKENQNTEFSYWIEDTLKCYI